MHNHISVVMRVTNVTLTKLSQAKNGKKVRKIGMPKFKIRNHKFVVPDVMSMTHYSKHETLLFLGAPIEEKDFTICLGLGLVKVIQKGEDFDLVCMDFGRGYSREIYVKNNHARRQIYTLKKGQYAWFYGLMKCYRNGKQIRTSLYAKAFQGWYVPKSMDIMKVDPEDVEELTKENESKINFIDELVEKGI